MGGTKKRPAAAAPAPPQLVKKPQQGKKIKVDMNGQHTMMEFQREVSVEVMRVLEEREQGPLEAPQAAVGVEEPKPPANGMDVDVAPQGVDAMEQGKPPAKDKGMEDNIDLDEQAEGETGFFPEPDRQGHVNVETFLTDVASNMVASLLKTYPDVAAHFHSWADRFYSLRLGTVCTGSGMAEIAAKAGMDALRQQLERLDAFAEIKFGCLDLNLSLSFL